MTNTVKLSNGATFTGSVEACAEFLKAFGIDKDTPTPSEKPSVSKKTTPKTHMWGDKPCTEKQYMLWSKNGTQTYEDVQARKQAWADGADERKAKAEEKRKEALAEWEKKHKAFKPSKALKDALKQNPCMTRKEAKAYGFVGTRDELKALKLELKVR